MWLQAIKIIGKPFNTSMYPFFKRKNIKTGRKLWISSCLMGFQVQLSNFQVYWMYYINSEYKSANDMLENLT